MVVFQFGFNFSTEILTELFEQARSQIHVESSLGLSSVQTLEYKNT